MTLPRGTGGFDPVTNVVFALHTSDPRPLVREVYKEKYVHILEIKLHETTPVPLKSKSNPRRYYRKIEKLNLKVKDLLYKIGLAQHTEESQRKGCFSHL